jgi:hypothetical protein
MRCVIALSLSLASYMSMMSFFFTRQVRVQSHTTRRIMKGMMDVAIPDPTPIAVKTQSRS